MIGKVFNAILDEHGHLEIDGLGIFKTEYQGSVIQFSTQTISPPVHLIYFEARSVSQTSPTLLQYFYQELGLNEVQTSEYLNQFVKKTLLDISSLGKSEIGDFGHLAKDIEGNLFFSPITGQALRLDSFGLNSLISQPVYTRQKQTQEREAPIIPLHPFDSEIRSTKELDAAPGRKVKFWAIGMVASAISIAMLSIFFLGQRATILDYTGSEVLRQDAGLIPLRTTSKNKVNYSVLPSAASEEMSTAKPANVSKATNETSEQAVALSDVNPHTDYHVIAGSFIMHDKCREFNKSLKKLGFDGNILPKNENGLHRISIGKFSSKESALVYLQEQQPKFEDQLWIFSE